MQSEDLVKTTFSSAGWTFVQQAHLTVRRYKKVAITPSRSRVQLGIKE